MYIQLRLYMDYFYNGVLEIKCQFKILNYILSCGITDHTDRFSPWISTSLIPAQVASQIGQNLAFLPH